MTVDHKKPQAIAKDDSVHKFDNLVIACRNCNSAKSDKQLEGLGIDEFRDMRNFARKRDEQWVQDRFNFIMDMSDQGTDIPHRENPWKEDYINKLAIGFNTKPDYFERVEVKKVNIPYIDFFNKGNEWTFTPSSFSLQPFFIYKHESTIKDNIFGSILDMRGYLGGSDYRSKYLKPFRTLDEGIATIINEIIWINDFWEHWVRE